MIRRVAAEALSSIEDSSRRAVAELHRLLGFLRRAGDTDELAPQPSLAQLGRSDRRGPRGKSQRRLTIRGDVRSLSPTLEVSAYRIIQEALTNIRKHSQASTAPLDSNTGPTELEVEILDDGPASEGRPGGGGTGMGLIGMRERAELHDGHLCATPDRGVASRSTRLPMSRDAA